MFYLFVLSIGDLFVLNSGLLRNWIKYTFDYDIRIYSQFVCKAHAYFVHFFLHFTTWILVAVTIDRCICVCMPFITRRKLTLRHAHVTTVVILISMLLLHIIFVFGVTLKYNNGDLRCTEDEGVINWRIWSWIDIIMFCLIPFTIMIICDIKITRRITRSVRKISKYCTGGGNPKIPVDNCERKGWQTHQPVTQQNVICTSCNRTKDASCIVAAIPNEAKGTGQDHDLCKALKEQSGKLAEQEIIKQQRISPAANTSTIKKRSNLTSNAPCC